MNCRRATFEKQRADALYAAYLTRQGIEREWWLSGTLRVTAKLDEENTHVGGPNYFTKPRLAITQHFSDTLNETEYVVTLNMLNNWQIRALLRLRDQWEAWCRNELVSMPPEIRAPTAEQTAPGGEWVDVWPNNVNPWPEANEVTK